MAKNKPGRTNQKQSTEAKLETLIHFLLDNPTASEAEQAKLLDMSVENLKKTYYKLLKKRGWAVINPVFTEEVRRNRERFWIFIETFYDKDHALKVVKDEMKDEHRYQQWVIKQLRERLHAYSGELRPGGAAVLLGSRFDIVFIVDATISNSELVHDFVTKHVRTCEHIRSTTTSWSQPEENRPSHAG